MDLKEYSFLRFLLVLMFVFILYLTFISNLVFFIFMFNYLAIASIFLLNRICFVFFALIFPKKYKRYNNSYSVILPVKDENKAILNKCVRMLVRQKGEKQILIGDDGSKIPIVDILDKDLQEHVVIIRSSGVGKKEMQVKLFNYVEHDIVVQIDSDVILSSSYDLQNLVSYFHKDNKIGIVNGRVRIVSNKKIIEKLQEFQYYCANDIGRVGMGRFGINPCATGELMAFRYDVFKKFINDYRNTKYLGKLMNFGEDRFMTNIFLREGI